MSKEKECKIKRVDFHQPIIFAGAPRNRVTNQDGYIVDVNTAVAITIKDSVYKIPYYRIDYIEYTC